MIRGTVHMPRKRAVRTEYRRWHVRKHPDTGAARGAAGGHARTQGRGAEVRRADALVAPGDGRSVRQVRGFLHPGPDTVRGRPRGFRGTGLASVDPAAYPEREGKPARARGHAAGPARRAAPAGSGTSSRRASARGTPAAAPWGRRTGRVPVTSGRNRCPGRPTGRRGRPSCGSAGGRCGTRRPTGRPSSPTRRTPDGRAVRPTAGSSAGTGPRSGPPRDGGGRTRTGRRIRGRWSPRRAGAGGPAPPRLRGFPGTGARPSRRRGGPRPAGQRPPPSREGARALPGAAGMPRPAAPPAAPRAAPGPTGRLWGVTHRHVRRDRLHADPRRFTGAVLRFPDGALPREREAIAESVTGGFRVVTHDGHRMAGQRIRPCGGANRARVRSSSVQRVYGRFEQKYGTHGDKTRTKMERLLNGDPRHMKFYKYRGRGRLVLLPYVVRNIIAHSGTNSNEMDQEGNELRQAIGLLKEWVGRTNGTAQTGSG